MYIHVGRYIFNNIKAKEKLPLTHSTLTHNTLVHNTLTHSKLAQSIMIEDLLIQLSGSVLLQDELISR